MGEGFERMVYTIRSTPAVHARLVLALQPHGITVEEGFQQAVELLMLVAEGELFDSRGRQLTFERGSVTPP